MALTEHNSLEQDELTSESLKQEVNNLKDMIRVLDEKMYAYTNSMRALEQFIAKNKKSIEYYNRRHQM